MANMTVRALIVGTGCFKATEEQAGYFADVDATNVTSCTITILAPQSRNVIGAVQLFCAVSIDKGGPW